MSTEIKAHLKIVCHPNQYSRSFHLTREVWGKRGSYSFGTGELAGSVYEEYPEESIERFAKQLSELPGVIEGCFSRYEVYVVIGEAFNWKEVGPLILGEIIKTMYPEVIGDKLEVSTSIGWNEYKSNIVDTLSEGGDGAPYAHYQDMTDRELVKVNFGRGRPVFDVEYLFSKFVIQAAKRKQEAETSIWC